LAQEIGQMKIPLNMGNTSGSSEKQEQARVLEHDIIACKGGDWEAKNRLTKAFTPLLLALAKKRSDDNGAINRYIEAGKNGLYAATRKYKPSIGADRFQIFALDFIEAQMNQADKPAGFFARLFGRG
jgi:hypothetical protein